MTDSD